jgi:hypothetical protein
MKHIELSRAMLVKKVRDEAVLSGIIHKHLSSRSPITSKRAQKVWRELKCKTYTCEYCEAEGMQFHYLSRTAQATMMLNVVDPLCADSRLGKSSEREFVMECNICHDKIVNDEPILTVTELNANWEKMTRRNA